MKIPTIKGVIGRRILLNYRIAPEVVPKVLPKNFRPKVVKGHAIGGICLIQLDHIRPKGLPAFMGICSENSAHRVAVEWEDENGKSLEGVFVPRRDTGSRLNHLAGGRIFPGVHHLSDFIVRDQDENISIKVTEKGQDQPLVDLEVEETNTFPETSVFSSLNESSKFFENGCIGYSSRPNSCVMDGLKLEVTDWKVTALNVIRVSSAYYDDRNLFPEGSIELDHALLMRDIPHLWHSEPNMTAEA